VAGSIPPYNGPTGNGNRMSQQTTIRKLAELVNTPVDKLLEQLA
jgi:translation initiation factor IF-2